MSFQCTRLIETSLLHTQTPTHTVFMANFLPSLIYPTECHMVQFKLWNTMYVICSISYLWLWPLHFMTITSMKQHKMTALATIYIKKGGTILNAYSNSQLLFFFHVHSLIHKLKEQLKLWTNLHHSFWSIQLLSFILLTLVLSATKVAVLQW